MELGIQVVLISAAFGAWVGPHSELVTGACLILAFPLPLIDALLVPAGLPHLSYYLARVSRPLPIAHESSGSAVFYELKARLRRGLALDDTGRARLERSLFVGRTGRTARGATV